MSLTSFLKLPDVKERFQQEFKVPRLSADKELMAPPLSRRYSLVGTAFDYLLHFWLKLHNKNTISSRWVAEEGLSILGNRDLDHVVYVEDTGELLTKDGRPFDTYKDPVFEKAKCMFNQVCVEHENYISTGKLTDKVIKSTIHLAQLDVIVRAGYIDEKLGKTYREDVKDLRNLIRVVKPELFKAKKLCLLNPSFGKVSTLLEGAEADLLIDDMLIDVKTTRNFRVEPRHFFQLLGYFTLHRLEGIGNLKPKPKITKVAIYFSRHAHLEIFELKHILNQGTFPKFVEWFSNRARQYSKGT